jgi:16S rRNA (cytosine967-C5)-methyltransferase
MQPELKNVLRAGLYEVVMDEITPAYAAVNAYVEIAKRTLGNGPGKLTNAILRKATELNSISKPDNCELNTWHSYPLWLWEKWTKQFGRNKTIALVKYFNERPKMDIHRNDSQLSHEELNSFCDEHDIFIELWNNSEIFYKVQRNMAELNILIVAGKVSVQNRASGMVVELLDPKPGETILDVCAAPGTKAAYTAELMAGDGKLYVSDSRSDRLEKFELTFENIAVDVKDASKDNYPIADAVLIDAPCSGTGVIGKKPDIRWRRSQNEMNEFVTLQGNILNHMSQFLKPVGRIIYSTCSIEPEENWGVVDAFLKLNTNYYMDMETNIIPDSWLDDRGALAPFPSESKTDGMFAVKLINGSE